MALGFWAARIRPSAEDLTPLRRVSVIRVWGSFRGTMGLGFL